MIIAISGCNQNRSTEESRTAIYKTIDPPAASIGPPKKDHHSVAQGAEKTVEQLDEIYDVAVIKGGKETLVAYKVKHMQRYRMKTIEKEVTEKLSKKYPKEKFTVSSDYKIFIETVELQERMKRPDYTSKEAEKQLKKIIKLKQELT
ncbi:sporulation protein [Bacillus sp. T33-2]|nr:sporulation protein [Bacillus sp. T33-2]